MDQAKFMRVRVALQLDKPLRRGGYVTNLEKKRMWVTFKYERLPSVCLVAARLAMMRDTVQRHQMIERLNANMETGFGQMGFTKRVKEEKNLISPIATLQGMKVEDLDHHWERTARMIQRLTAVMGINDQEEIRGLKTLTA